MVYGIFWDVEMDCILVLIAAGTLLHYNMSSNGDNIGEVVDYKTRSILVSM